MSSLRMMEEASNAGKLPHRDSELFSVGKALYLPKGRKLRTALLNPLNTHSRFRSQFHKGRELKQKLTGLELHCVLPLHDVTCPRCLRNPLPGNSVKSAFQQESESWKEFAPSEIQDICAILVTFLRETNLVDQMNRMGKGMATAQRDKERREKKTEGILLIVLRAGQAGKASWRR